MRVILFNLVPYRERALHRRRMAVLAQCSAGVLLMLAGVLSIHAELSGREQAQVAYLGRLHAVQAEIEQEVLAVQAVQTELAELQRKIDAFDAVEHAALQPSQVLALLDATTPQSADVAKVQVKAGVLTLSGNTQSVPSLAVWVDTLERYTTLFEQVDVVSVVALERSAQPVASSPPPTATHRFELTALLKQPGAGQATRSVEVANALD